MSEGNYSIAAFVRRRRSEGKISDSSRLPVPREMVEWMPTVADTYQRQCPSVYEVRPAPPSQHSPHTRTASRRGCMSNTTVSVVATPTELDPDWLTWIQQHLHGTSYAACQKTTNNYIIKDIFRWVSSFPHQFCSSTRFKTETSRRILVSGFIAICLSRNSHK